MEKLRMLMADDHNVVRHGLKQIIQKEFPTAEIIECSDGEELIQNTRSGPWDIIITDITMPGKPGFEVIQQILDEFPKYPVLVLTAHPENQYGMRILKAGAAGYLTKNAPAEELIRAIRFILRGLKYASQEFTERLIADLSGNIQDKKLHEQLSDREFEVFKKIALGKSLIEIGKEIGVGPTTISTYRARILAKMSMTSNAECTRYAIENDLI